MIELIIFGVVSIVFILAAYYQGTKEAYKKTIDEMQRTLAIMDRVDMQNFEPVPEDMHILMTQSAYCRGYQEGLDYAEKCVNKLKEESKKHADTKEDITKNTQ